MSDMHEEPEEIEVRYTRAMVSGAVRTFVRRSLDRRIIAAVVLLLLTIPLWAPVKRLPVIYAIVIAFLVGFALLIWLAQHLYKARTLRRMGRPIAWVRMTADGLGFRSDTGRGELPFAMIEAVWSRPDCLVLVTGSNRFTILPTDDLPDCWLLTLLDRCAEQRPASRGQRRSHRQMGG